MISGCDFCTLTSAESGPIVLVTITSDITPQSYTVSYFAFDDGDTDY